VHNFIISISVQNVNQSHNINLSSIVFEQLLATPLPKETLKIFDVPNLIFKLFNLGFVTTNDLAKECKLATTLAEKLEEYPLVAMAVVLARFVEKRPDAKEVLEKVLFYLCYKFTFTNGQYFMFKIELNV